MSTTPQPESDLSRRVLGLCSKYCIGLETLSKISGVPREQIFGIVNNKPGVIETTTVADLKAIALVFQRLEEGDASSPTKTEMVN